MTLPTYASSSSLSVSVSLSATSSSLGFYGRGLCCFCPPSQISFAVYVLFIIRACPCDLRWWPLRPGCSALVRTFILSVAGLAAYTSPSRLTASPTSSGRPAWSLPPADTCLQGLNYCVSYSQRSGVASLKVSHRSHTIAVSDVYVSVQSCVAPRLRDIICHEDIELGFYTPAQYALSSHR